MAANDDRWNSWPEPNLSNHHVSKKFNLQKVLDDEDDEVEVENHESPAFLVQSWKEIMEVCEADEDRNWDH